MKLPPLSVISTWPTPNYIDPPTRGHGILIANVVCLSLAFIVVCLRLYTRLRITFSAGFDDILIILGFIFTTAMGVLSSIGTEKVGMNRHVWDIELSNLVIARKIILSGQICFAGGACFIKVALLWFCRRLISKGHMRLYNWAFNLSMIFVGLLWILFTFITIFQCSPTRAYWQIFSTEPHHCLNESAIATSASIISTITDFLVTVLPMPLIWSLKLRARQRLAVISIFALGFLVNVAACVRTFYVWKSLTAYDITWVGWPFWIASMVEMSLGLICSSAPALRPLIAAILPHLLDSTRNTDSSSKRNNSHKLWSSKGSSRTPRLIADDSRQPVYESDRFEINRTVEMEIWSESRLPNHDKSGHDFDITSDNCNRAISPVGSTDMKSGVAHGSLASVASSISGPSETQYHLEMGQARQPAPSY